MRRRRPEPTIIADPLEREVRRRVERGAPADDRLAYLPVDVAPERIARTLVAMANADGGVVVVGVETDADGRPHALGEVGFRNVVARETADVLAERASPGLEFAAEAVDVGAETLLALAVETGDRPRSYRDDPDGPPTFPVRDGATVDHLSGAAVGAAPATDDDPAPAFDDDRVARRADDPQFVAAPGGRVGSLCLFSGRYYPVEPTRVRLSVDYVDDDRAEAVLAALDEVFDAATDRAPFTVAQRNGAWVGHGYYAFVAALRRREERYAAVAETGYDLDPYDTEQAVLATDLGTAYPDSAALVYAAPFVDDDGYRRVTVNFVVDGHPVDTRPLVAFADRVDARLDTAETVTVETTALDAPGSVPVEDATPVSRTNTLGGDPSVVGVFCDNPFHGRDDRVAEAFGLGRGSALARYERLYASLADWDTPGSDRRYETERFVVTDWNSFTAGVRPTVHEVGVVANW